MRCCVKIEHIYRYSLHSGAGRAGCASDRVDSYYFPAVSMPVPKTVGKASGGKTRVWFFFFFLFSENYTRFKGTLQKKDHIKTVLREKL